MPNRKLEIVLLCPTGQDAPLIAAALETISLTSKIINSVQEFCELSFENVGGFIVAQEAFNSENLDLLSDFISNQEPWSDIPIILLIKGANKNLSNIKRLDTFISSGNVTLLERPLRPLTLLSATKVAVRSRQRQYQVKELLADQMKATVMRDEFISVASHELKTPLTSLKLQTQMALKNLVANEELSTQKINNQLNHTIKQVDRLNKLVDDMLDISRINTGKLQLNREDVNFSELIYEIIERFRPQFNAVKIKIETDIEENIFGFWDVFKIEQVVNNIFSNAIRYSPDAIVKIKLKKIQNHAVFSVEDHGPGIDQENIERIFERFERVSSSVGGLGLGLYITKQILELHNGFIDVESTIGKGSIFSIKLPLEK